VSVFKTVYLITIKNGKISYDDKLGMQTLREQQFGAKAVIAKRWNLTTVKRSPSVSIGRIRLIFQFSVSYSNGRRLFHEL